MFVDMNGLIHPALRDAEDQSSFILNLFKMLDRTLAYVKPKQSVTLSVDGPAPVAKILTQRERRAAVCKGGKRVGDAELLKMAITPGTELMSETLNNALKYYTVQRLNTQKYRNLVFEVCGADVPGEGEVKMLHKVEALQHTGGGSSVLVGNDSDLVLLAMSRRSNAKPCVLHEGLPSRKSKAKRSPMMLFRTDVFEHKLMAQLPTNAPRELSKMDFVLLCCMCGNDYLPSAGHMGIQRSFEPYKALKYEPGNEKRTLVTKNRSLDWEMMQKLANKVLAQYPEQNMGSSPNASRHVDASLLSNSQLLQGYVNGLLWVLETYLDGKPPHATWQYYAGARAPIAAEFATLPAPKYLKPPRSKRSLPTPLDALLSSLPRGARSLVPKGLQHLMDGSSNVRDVYMSDHCAECLKISRLESKATKNYADALQRAQAAGRSTSDEVKESHQVLKELGQRRQRHMREDPRHLPRPFPFARLQKAVKSVPDASLKPKEAARRQFDVPLAMWNANHHSIGRARDAEALHTPSPPGRWAYENSKQQQRVSRSSTILCYTGDNALARALQQAAQPHDQKTAVKERWQVNGDKDNRTITSTKQQSQGSQGSKQQQRKKTDNERDQERSNGRSRDNRQTKEFGKSRKQRQMNSGGKQQQHPRQSEWHQARDAARRSQKGNRQFKDLTRTAVAGAARSLKTWRIPKPLIV